MVTFPHQSEVTIEEYLEFCRSHPDERYELIDGQIRMLAGGKVDHSRIAANIIVMLGNTLRGSCQVFTSDAVFKLPSGNCVLPDVMVTCDEQDYANNDYIEHPCVVFEVLSPGTELIDRGQKFTYYRDCPTIQEYVMVNTKEPLIEVFRREKRNMWTYHMFEQDEIVTITSLGISLPVRNIYKNTLLLP